MSQNKGRGSPAPTVANRTMNFSLDNSKIPSNSKASVGMPRLVKTPGLEMSLESLDSLIEKRKLVKG